MNNFLKNVMNGNGTTPSDLCLLSFNKHFKNAINVEWFDKNTFFEAIFYKDNLEHIAIFNLKGELTEYRQNLPPDYLPGPIKQIALAKGEIMNAVMKNKGHSLEYEIIVRDNELNRYLITLSDVGKLLQDKLL